MPERNALNRSQRFVAVLLAAIIALGALVLVPIIQSRDQASKADVLENRRVSLQSLALLRDIDRRVTAHDQAIAELERQVDALLRAHGRGG